MKQTIIITAIAVSVMAIMAFSNSENKSVGALGDVKYSVLPPDKFKDENGDGWVIMDDNVPLQDSDLKSKHGITSVPDARGLFIRCMNLKRNDAKADPSSPRAMGEYQSDAVGKHSHQIDMGTAYMPNIGDWQHPPAASYIYVANRPAYNNSYGALTATDNQLNIETRPKNIALYTYIKIKD